MRLKLNRTTAWLATLVAIPVGAALFVWLSPLCFVPIPWPDDSAFYFVAREFFKWPPRWVMLPQAPFEPTYAIFNFNTMPLYPILIGLGRWIGIDGSFLLKLWPLTAWAATGAVLGVTLFRAGLAGWAAVLITAVFALDPALRWGAVVVRPESLVGLFGALLIYGVPFHPKKFERRAFWDPVAFLLTLAAYSHFNAVHLVFPVAFLFLDRPKRLLEIAGMTLLYLAPWLLLIAFHRDLFVTQMTLQWSRLEARNAWLDSPLQALDSLYDTMGTPGPWPGEILIASAFLWTVILGALGFFLVGTPLFLKNAQRKHPKKTDPKKTDQKKTELKTGLALAVWILSSCLLVHSKPEAWFKYYIHLSIWFAVGAVALHLGKTRAGRRSPLIPWAAVIGGVGAIFLYVNVTQVLQLSKTVSWHWPAYYQFVDCIDSDLTDYRKHFDASTHFEVWCPTPPDVTIELSRRHPDWAFTRTNDFWDRAPQAIEHGNRVHAVVVTEPYDEHEWTVSGPASQFPYIQSLWMKWEPYFLNRLWTTIGWKPNRTICSVGRWRAFLFMNVVK